MTIYHTSPDGVRREAGSELSEADSNMEQLVTLKAEMLRVAATLPEAPARDIRIAADNIHEDYAKVDVQVGKLLAERGFFSFVDDATQAGIHNARSGIVGLKIKHPTGRFGHEHIAPKSQPITSSQFAAELARKMTEAGVKTSDQPDYRERVQAYDTANNRVLDGIHGQAYAAFDSLEVNLNNPTLVAIARERILDQIVDNYLKTAYGRLNEIKAIIAAGWAGNLAINGSKLEASAPRTMGNDYKLGQILLIAANFRVNEMLTGSRYILGRSTLEKVGLIGTEMQLLALLQPIVESYTNQLHQALGVIAQDWLSTLSQPKSIEVKPRDVAADIAERRRKADGEIRADLSKRLGRPVYLDDPTVAAEVTALREQADRRIYRGLFREFGSSDEGYLRALNLALRNREPTPTERANGPDYRYQ